MNDVQKEATPAAETAKRVCGTLLTTLVDVGSAWAAHGLKIGKMALATSAETLGKTAHLLDVIATELEKNKPAEPPAATPAPAEPAEQPAS
jgi:hypothetical protein